MSRLNYFGIPPQNDGQLLYKIGYNDQHGNVFCGLCQWVENHKSLEQIEFRLAKHLLETHGLVLTHKQDFQGNQLRVQDIPTLDLE